MDADSNDFAAGLSECLLKDGSQTPIANIPMGGFKITNLANGIANTDAATYGQAVVYKQGATGSTLRTVQSKLQESVSVLDFGADPTGVADSATAFSSAAAAVGTTGQVIVPAGLWKLSATTTAANYLVTPGATFTGAGGLGGRREQLGGYGQYSNGGKIGAFLPYVETGIRTSTEIASDLAVLSSIGQIGLLGGSQSSLSAGAGSQGCIGVAGFANNNNTSAIQTSYGGYFEVRRQIGAGGIHGIELDSVNFGTVVPAYPASIGPTGLTNGFWVASGRE